MNYNKLKYFFEVAKLQNLSYAANILFVSQSNLSKAISDLENDFGTPLFIRTNRSLVLTDAGKELQRQIEPFFSRENDIYNAVRAADKQSAADLQATINLGFMTFSLTARLSDLIKDFKARYPSIDVCEYRYNKKDLLLRLHHHELDVAFVIFSMDELHSDFSYRILSECHLSAIVRDDHPLAGRSLVSLSELKNEKFIMHGHSNNSNEYTNAIAWCKRNGFYPSIIGEYDYVETVLMLIQSGMGISILSDAAPIQNMKGLVNVSLKNAPALYEGILWNKKNPKKTDDVLELLIKYSDKLLEPG